MIDVANPFDPADNAAAPLDAHPAARRATRSRAVATPEIFLSAARRYSHGSSTRASLQPVRGRLRRDPVVAGDCVTANATLD